VAARRGFPRATGGVLVRTAVCVTEIFRTTAAVKEKS